MHFAQIAIGGAAVMGFAQFAVIKPIKDYVAPVPAAIVIHSLTVDNGVITQDRTVSTEGRFTAVWNARIVDENTGAAVPNCYGSGVWHYSPGRQAVDIPLREWVGNNLCTLQPGRYQAMAIYEAGTFKASARSKVFIVGGGR